MTDINILTKNPSNFSFIITIREVDYNGLFSCQKNDARSNTMLQTSQKAAGYFGLPLFQPILHSTSRIVIRFDENIHQLPILS